MRLRSLPLALAMLLGPLPGPAAALPLLDLAEPVVVPGALVDVTVLGRPGHHFALAASPAGTGLTVAGRPLRLGPDAQIVATGQLDADGRALVPLTPDFAGADRLHLQAVTAPGPAFEGFTPTPGKVLRNAHLWLPAALARHALAAVSPDAGLAASDPRRELPTGALTEATAAGLAAAPPGSGDAPGCVACVGPGSRAAGAAAPEAGEAAGPATRLAPSPAWLLAGNAGTTPATQFLGTTDAQPLELRVAGQRALRLEPPGAPDPVFGTSPNLLAGLPLNTLTPGVVGATLAGGGASAGSCAGAGTPCPNRVTDDFGTIGGGADNQAGNGAGTPADRRFATVGGGFRNTASGSAATVSGGQSNTASGPNATVGGGLGNTASELRATVGGGQSNTASELLATVGGGLFNTAGGPTATVGGGSNNTASGTLSTVPGGGAAVASLHGQLAHGAGAFFLPGDAQWSVYTLRRETTSNTPAALLLDGQTLTAKLTVAPGRTLAFDGLVVARRLTDGAAAGYRIEGLVKNVNGTVTAFAVSATALFEENAAWNVQVLGDDIDKSLLILVTGENNTTIRWVGVVRTVEVAF